LGNLLDRPVTNLGKNGTGNTRIVKRTIDVAFCDDTELIIIAWVGPYRIEFFNKVPYDIWPGSQAGNIPKEIVNALTVIQNDQFDLWLYKKWLRDIILIQNLLKNQNKKYLMSVAWHPWEPVSGTENLWNNIDWQYFLGHPTNSANSNYENFGYWFADSPRGPGKHPLELGHQKIAEKFYEHIRNLGWFS